MRRSQPNICRPIGPLAAAALGLLLILPAAAEDDQGRTGENVELTGTYTDVQFLAGRTVRIAADVADDVFAAGRSVTFDGATVKNVIAAGYEVRLTGSTASDMIAAAADMDIAGTIEDDLVAAARTLRIDRDARIGGDARLAARELDVAGNIGGSLKAAAREVTISGSIAGKADLYAETVVVSPGAHIAGDLVYRSPNEAQIADGATVDGEVRHLPAETPDIATVGLVVLGIGVLVAVAWTVAMLVLAAVVQLAVPEATERAAGELVDHPWASLGRGVAAVVVLGAVAGLLVISLFGLPLGIVVLMLLGVLWFLGMVVVAYFIGLQVRARVGGTGAPAATARIGWTWLGLLVLGVVSWIPFVGAAVSTLAVAAGFGAAGNEIWHRLRAT